MLFCQKALITILLFMYMGQIAVKRPIAIFSCSYFKNIFDSLSVIVMKGNLLVLLSELENWLSSSKKPTAT